MSDKITVCTLTFSFTVRQMGQKKFPIEWSQAFPEYNLNFFANIIFSSLLLCT
jgi:hypothetical protein